MANGNAGRSIVGGINGEGTPARAEWGTAVVVVVSFGSVPRERRVPRALRRWALNFAPSKKGYDGER